MDIGLINRVRPELLSCSHISGNYPGTRNKSFGVRMVQNYELDYITWGQGFVVTDGEIIPAVGGTLFFRTPGMVVEGIRPYHCYYLTMKLFNDPGKSIKPGLFPHATIMKETDRIESIFARIYNENLNRKETTEFIVRTLIMELLLELYDEVVSCAQEAAAKSGPYKENYRIIQSVAAYIRDNAHSRDINLDMLSDMAGYSRYFFCRTFHEIMGRPPINYLNKCRIQLAMRLLLETDLSVKEVMNQCGFDSSSYFYRVFNEYNGCSPSSFRKRNRLWKL